MSMRIQSNVSHVSGICNGTPLYIAPEIIQSHRASKSSDVYSFGVSGGIQMDVRYARSHLDFQCRL